MTKTSRSLLAGLCGLMFAGASHAETIPAASTAPPTILWNAEHLAGVKEGWSKGDKTYAAEIEGVLAKADAQLKHEPYTIVTRARPKGNYPPNDYFSMGPYWWPNPETKDGLPYIRKDGLVNPESAYNRTDLSNFIKAVRNLSLAAYLTGEEKYASRAALFIKAWFLDEKTRMNPNLRFAQGVPGVSEGRGAGLIDMTNMRELIDAMQLLSLSPAWPKDDQARVKAWFGEFLQWYLDSESGKTEAAEKNNHGTWYRQQVALYAAYVGWEELVKPFFGGSMDQLIEGQVKPDGQQPLELKRTRAMSYSLFNAQAWEDIATLSPRYGQNYWDAGAPVGKKLKAAIDFLAPFGDPASKWMQEKVERNGYWLMLAQASHHYGEAEYAEALKKLPETVPEMMWQRLVFSPKK